MLDGFDDFHFVKDGNREPIRCDKPAKGDSAPSLRFLDERRLKLKSPSLKNPAS